MVEFLNLPNGENQRRMADALERIAAESATKVTDYTNAPGPKVLVAGTRENGFYGFVQPHEFGQIGGNASGKKDVTASNLALAIGLPQGSPINEDTPFMKFSRKGEIYFVPVKPIRHSTTWDQIYNAGAVYGDGTAGVVPPGGRAGKRLSANAGNNSFNIEVDSNGYGFLRSGGDTAKIGDTIVAKGFTNPENNGEFVVQSISNTSIVVNKTLKDETSAPKGVVYEKAKAVTQNKTVTIGGNRYRVQLLKGASQDPLNSFLDSDRDLVGPASEWNHLILPLHERAKLQNWLYKAYAVTTEDWGVGLTDADLITHHALGPGSYTWCQETSDESSYRRVFRGGLGASYGYHNYSWLVYSYFGFRPALRLLS